MTSSGTTAESGHVPNAVDPSRSSATVAAYGLGGRYWMPFACIPYSPCCAWKPPLKAATRCFITSGVRGTVPGPCSPLAATGSVVPASMCSAICRGSHSVT
jgi:hypothetical protein